MMDEELLEIDPEALDAYLSSDEPQGDYLDDEIPPEEEEAYQEHEDELSFYEEEDN